MSENQSSIFGVRVSQISTSQGGISQDYSVARQGQAQIPCDSAFSQMMQLLFGFCRDSNCRFDTVRENDTSANIQGMQGIFTKMCPSLTQQLSPEELQAYGVPLKFAQAD